MNESDEASGAVQALLEYINAVHARFSALEVLTDALIGTLGKTLPPLLPVLQENLLMLADAREQELKAVLCEPFRGHVAEAYRKIEAVM